MTSDFTPADQAPSGDMVTRAEALARHAHRDQTDQAGRPYAEHPARVAARLADDERAAAAAWLHDVVEDTPVTLDELSEQFPAEVVSAVDAVTKRPGEAPDDYYRRVAADPIGLRVKLADLADNSDPDRLALLPEETRQRLEAKYANARAKLGGAP